MTTSMTMTSPQPRSLWRSTRAVLLAFFTVVALSLGTDQLLHSLDVYPPWGQPMYDTGLLLLALTYRTVYSILGSYLAARFAPHAPMRHALILGVIGTVISGLGVIASIAAKLGPAWYPISITITALPTAWLGGALYLRGTRRS